MGCPCIGCFGDGVSRAFRFFDSRLEFDREAKLGVGDLHTTLCRRDFEERGPDTFRKRNALGKCTGEIPNELVFVLVDSFLNGIGDFVVEKARNKLQVELLENGLEREHARATVSVRSNDFRDEQRLPRRDRDGDCDAESIPCDLRITPEAQALTRNELD